MLLKTSVFLVFVGCASNREWRSSVTGHQLHRKPIEDLRFEASSFIEHQHVQNALVLVDASGGSEDAPQNEGGDDEDEDPPWMMSRFDKIWLQVGWLIQVVTCLGIFLLLKFHWPYKQSAESVLDRTGEVYSGPAVTLYKLLWGESPMGLLLNYLIISVALLNFVLFALQTEANFRAESPTPMMPEVPLSSWVTTANQWVQSFSTLFFATLLVLRMLAAQAHPNFRRYGRHAWWRWLSGSIYAQIEVVALLPSFFDMLTGRDDFLNLVWLSLARTISWMERLETSGIAIRQLRIVLHSEGPLLATMFIFGIVLWILISGFYFLANQHNEAMLWEAAVLKETGEKWQRFESIPSSMFFVLLNLCKENPLAEYHEEFWSRLIVVIVCFIGTPIFALPTGVLGVTIQNKTQDEIDARDENNAAPDEQADDASGNQVSPPAWGATPTPVPVPAVSRLGRAPHPLLQFFEESLCVAWFTALLSFGSVFAYFYHTAGPTNFLFLKIFIGAGTLAWIDGIVGLIFAVEWFFRLLLSPHPYICSLLCAIDLVAWLPGLFHLFLHCTGGILDSSACMWLLAACVLRVLKCERYCKAFHDMFDILHEHSAILKATLFITSLLWIVFSTLLYYTERDSADEDMQENYGSAFRALWAEVINLHGEWVWCDYSATGKGICTIIALFSQGLFMIPICVFSDGFQERLGNMDQLEDNLEVQPWQEHHRPPRGHKRRPLYDLLYAHLHLPKAKQIAETRRSLAEAAAPRPSQISMHSFASSAASARSLVSAGGSRVRGGGRHTILDTIPNLSFGYRAFRFFSIFFVFAVTLSTTTLTIERMKHDECHGKDWCVMLDWAFYLVDLAAAVFFSLELAMRIMAVGLHHPCSFVGYCDVISLLAIWATLTPFRRVAFHPTYDTSRIVDDMAVPLRLLRLFCLDSYLHPLHTLSRIAWVQRQALLRSFYALVSFWYIFTTLLYLFEWDPEERATADHAEQIAADNEEELPELIMAQRFRDILTGLQYSLVHLTGDYPITEYALASRIVHVFGILFGMCMVSAFTGIFVSGFMNYHRSERIVERRQEADRRLTQVLFTVLLVQRQFRRIRNRRLALMWARNAPEGAALPSALSALQIEARNVERRQAQLRSALQNIKVRSTPEGRRIMLVCNTALIVNITANLIGSMPEARENGHLLQALDFIELFTGYIFVLEYMMHLGASASLSREILKPMRLIDLFCLLPTFVRMWLINAPFGWREMHPRFAHVLELGLISRVLRVLDFPFVRRTGQKAFRAVTGALGGLVQPTVLAAIIWITSTSIFMWVENVCKGREKKNMNSLPDALYWTSIYIIGEWANVDFSPGAGSRMCIFYCLFGVAVFAVPVGLMMEAVEATLTSIAEERKTLQSLLGKSMSARTVESSTDA